MPVTPLDYEQQRTNPGADRLWFSVVALPLVGAVVLLFAEIGIVNVEHPEDALAKVSVAGAVLGLVLCALGAILSFLGYASGRLSRRSTAIGGLLAVGAPVIMILFFFVILIRIHPMG
jgi:hypothetical protein